MLTEWWICIFQVEKTQRQRFYAAFFNANAEIVKNLNIPKARGDGEFVASYSGFSLNATTGFAEGVVEYSEKIWSDKLEEHLAEQGAACITILTFANNDNNQSAGAALARVWKSAKAPGFELVAHGECNARLLAKAEEIMLEDKQKEKEIDEECGEKIQAGLKQSLALQEEMNEKMVTKDLLKDTVAGVATKGELAIVGETSQKSLALQETLKDTVAAVATKGELAIVGETSQKSLALQETLKDTVAGVATKDDVAKSQEELTKMRERAEHAENFSFVKRGQLGAEESKKVKSLRREMEMKDKEIAKLRRQMNDRDKKDAERDNHIQERNTRVDAHIARTEQFIGQMEDRDRRREESDGTLREILGRLERALEDV